MIHIDAPAADVQDMLDYITGNLTEIRTDRAKALFEVADTWGLKGLAEACISSLRHNLTPESLPDLLCLCDAHCCEDLMQACVTYVTSTPHGLQDIVSDAAFLKVMAERPTKVQEFLLACMSQNDWGPAACSSTS